MKLKKTLLRLGAVTSVAVPVVAVVSCGTNLEDSKPFTVGFAMDPVTSLNYLKYQSTVGFSHSVVESLTKSGPQTNSALQNAMSSIQKLTWHSGAYNEQGLSTMYSIYSGTLRSSAQTTSKTDIAFDTFDGISARGTDGTTVNWRKSTKIFDVNLNGKSVWANGDKLTASNFIDFVTYVLDLNTGSQFYKELIDLDISYSSEFVDAQTEYAKTFGVLYKNPFGYEETEKFKNGNLEAHETAYRQRESEFPLQQFASGSAADQAKERAVIAKIEHAARNLGVFGDDESSHPFSKRVDGDTFSKQLNAIEETYQAQGRTADFSMNKDKEAYEATNSRGEKSYPYRLRFTTNMDQNAFSYVVNKLSRSSIMPVNRRFVEQVGVENFGLSKDKFLTEGAFDIDELTLGDRGGALFKRNPNYWDAANTIPETVRIYFQTDPIIKANLLKDGYISYTTLNAMATKDLYSNEDYRRLVTKSGGYGTTGLVFNMDKNSEGYNEAFDDPNLRKAIFYAIDREEVIKLSGFDATLPAYSITDSNYQMDYDWIARSNGVNFVSTYSDQTFTPSISNGHDDVKLFPLPAQSYSANSILLGNVDKTDQARNLDLARVYFAKFKENRRAQGKSTNVNIEFTHDSTNSLLNTGIAIQTQLKEAFGGQINLDLKGYPKSIYDSFVSQGKFSITYKNMDYLSHSEGFYVDAFFIKDAISQEDRKTMGFVSNPTGGWVFSDVVNLLENKLYGEKVDEFKTRLNITDLQWEKIKYLSEEPSAGTPEEKVTLHKRKINSFFAKAPFDDGSGSIQPVDENFDSSKEIGALVVALNKIIMDQSPVIPLFVVDISISVSRMTGYKIQNKGGLYSFDYAYDIFRRPRTNLPGMEAIGE